MNLDHMTIAVRRRTLAELYDLALLVIRQHFLPLAALAVLGALPWVVLDVWLLRGTDEFAVAWICLFVLVVAQAPLATAALTAYLGEAMFQPKPSVRRAAQTALRRTGELLQVGALYGVLAVLPVLLVLAPPHMVAVIVLEQQHGRAAWTRAQTLRVAWTTGWPSHIVVGAGVAFATLVMLVGTVDALEHVLLAARIAPDWLEVLPHFDPRQSAVPAIAAFGALAYLAIVHFLSYLDLRTEREGWDIDLDLRRAADRLQEAL